MSNKIKTSAEKSEIMNQPIRVAHIIGKMVNGGIESVVMNYYRHIDRTKVQFDFFVDEDYTEEFKVMPPEEIRQLGGRVIIVPPYQQLNRYIPELVRLFRENRYQIVHSHINTLSVFPLYAAKKAGVPIRIAHNHSTAAKGEWKKNILKYALRPFAKVYATHYAACSRTAGEWLFGKKAMERGEVTIFNNAIDLEKFRFNPAVRDEVRKELGIEDKYVIGHVGRFCYQKNQEFLIDIFAEVYKQRHDAVLLMIGDGKDRTRIEKKIKKRSLENVILLGNREDVNRLYQAMDVFVFPSQYEGFGMGAVEAQICGVKTIVSKALPLETVIASTTIVLDLKDGEKVWAQEILQCNAQNTIVNSAYLYDISKQVNKLTEYYETHYYEK